MGIFIGEESGINVAVQSGRYSTSLRKQVAGFYISRPLYEVKDKGSGASRKLW